MTPTDMLPVPPQPLRCFCPRGFHALALGVSQQANAVEGRVGRG